jgi:protein TonB
MFDLIAGKARHVPSHSTLPIIISTVAQAATAAVAITVSALLVAEHIPTIPTMLAFVPPAPSPPPPPAPPPPAQRSASVTPVTRAEPAGSTREEAVAVDEARSSEPETTDAPSFGDGVASGVEGGVPGGIAGGLVGGLPEPPPPPPLPPAPSPIRIGGKIQSPTLLHRVEPVYPPVAVSARLQGVVILEALVERDGTVVDVRVLRSAGSVLDREALIAVRQWRYAPLRLNGQHLRFVVTVVLSFTV